MSVFHHALKFSRGIRQNILIPKFDSNACDPFNIYHREVYNYPVYMFNLKHHNDILWNHARGIIKDGVAAVENDAISIHLNEKTLFFFFGRCDRFLVFKFHTLMTFSVLKLLRDLVLIYPSKSQTFYQTGNRKAICCDFYRPLKTLNHLQKSARQRKEPDSLNKKNL